VPLEDLLDTDFRYLTDEETAEVCEGYGLPIKASTLGKMRCTGGGPPFVKFGRAARYREDWVLTWLRKKLSAPLLSTSQLADLPLTPAQRRGSLKEQLRRIQQHYEDYDLSGRPAGREAL
jgi:hypothetical protein